MNPYGQAAGVTSVDQTGTESTDQSSTVTNNASDQNTITSTGVTDQSNSLSGVHLAQFFGFFNIAAGLMLVAAFLLFFGGFIAYLTRLGLENRYEGLVYMYWGLSVLFVLIVLLAAIHFIQFHPTLVFIAISVVVLIFIAVAVVRASQESGHEEEH